jgi:uncharacterized protein
MTARRLVAPAPLVNPETARFWEAALAGQLLLKRCEACATVIWYPRAICPLCWSVRTEWFEATGGGTVYSYTVNRRGEGHYAGSEPFAIAYVELDEGPRVLTNIVDTPLEQIRIGARVEAVFHDTGCGTALPRFRASGNRA